MLTSPALFSIASSRSASTRAISTRSVGMLSRPGSTGPVLTSSCASESSDTDIDDADSSEIVGAVGAARAAIGVAGAGVGAAACAVATGAAGLRGGGLHCRLRGRRLRSRGGGRRRRRGRRVRGDSAAQVADLLQQGPRGRGQYPGAHQIAHARELVEACLHHRMRMVVPHYHAAVDRNHQRLELVAQIAHGGDTRHAGAALQRVQRALQLGDGLLVLAIVIPGGERQLGSLDQLGRLLAVDIGDLVIELIRRVGARLGRGGMPRAGSRGDGLRELRHDRGRAGLDDARELGIDLGLEHLPSAREARVARRRTPSIH